MEQDKGSVQNMMRVGVVSAVFPERMTVKVAFDDKDDGEGNPLISAELPVLTWGSSKNRCYWMPDVDEQVWCLMLPNGHSAGICLGSYFSQKMPPNASSIDKRRIDFADDTFVEYDRSTHELKIECVGDVIIKGKNIRLN